MAGPASGMAASPGKDAVCAGRDVFAAASVGSCAPAGGTGTYGELVSLARNRYLDCAFSPLPGGR